MSIKPETVLGRSVITARNGEALGNVLIKFLQSVHLIGEMSSRSAIAGTVAVSLANSRSEQADLQVEVRAFVRSSRDTGGKLFASPATDLPRTAFS